MPFPVVDARYARCRKALRCSARPKGETNTRFASLRIGARARLRHRARCEARWDRESLRSKQPYCSWAPWEASTSAGVWGRVRSTLRQLTSRGCLSAAAAGREASSARGPKHRAPQSSPALSRPPPSGPPFFGDFLSGKRKKVTALSGAYPDAASRSEQTPRKSTARLRQAQPERLEVRESRTRLRQAQPERSWISRPLTYRHAVFERRGPVGRKKAAP